MPDEQLNFDQFQTSYTPNSEMFSIQDALRQEVIVIRADQLAELAKEYCLIFGYKLVKKEE